MNLSIRRLVCLLCLALLWGSVSFVHARQEVTTSPAETSSLQSPVTLKEAAHGKFKVGVGVSARIATSEQDWPLLTSQFSIITPENCMKPQAI